MKGKTAVGRLRLGPINATVPFEVLARCQTAAAIAGAEQSRIQTFLEEAVSGDFEHLLRVVKTHFEISNAGS